MNGGIFNIGSPLNSNNRNFTVGGGNGILNLTGVNTFGTGTFTLAGGVLNINSTALIQAATIAINGGTLANGSATPLLFSTTPISLGGAFGYSGTSNMTISSPTTLTANATMNVLSGTVTISSPIAGIGSPTLGKTGVGELILSGASALTNGIAVAQGTLSITNSVSNTAAGNPFAAGLIAGQIGVISVDGGTLTSARNAGNPATSIGSASGAIGILRINSGVVTTTAGEFDTGNTAGAYGAIIVIGGTLSSGFIGLGRVYVGATPGFSILDVNGGLLTTNNNEIIIGSYRGGTYDNLAPQAVATFRGGTVTTGTSDMFVGESNQAILTIMGTAVVSNGTQVELTDSALQTSGSVLNLDGGTLTSRVTYGGGTGIVNLNGGVFRPNANNAVLIPANAGGRTYVWGGNAVIDDNGLTATISQALLVPTGSGVSTIAVGGATTLNGTASAGTNILAVANTTGLMAGMTIFSNSTGIPAGTTISVVNGSSVTMTQTTTATVAGGTAVNFNFAGYAAEPTAIISGGGSGATAIANVNSAGVLTSITVSNPGVGYSAGTSVTLTGGGGFSGTLPVQLTTNATNGGLTKLGAGTLILATAAPSTYAGATTVNRGTLLFNFGATPLLSSNMVSSASGLVVNGANVSFTTNATTGAQQSQTFANTTFGSGPGESIISVALNTLTANAGLLVNLGAVSRNAVGAVVDFQFNSSVAGASTTNGITTTTANTNYTSVGGNQSIIGGWATYGNGSSFATSASNGTSAGAISALNVFDTTYTPGTNEDAQPGSFTVTSPLVLNSLRFSSGGVAIDATGGLTIASGGILETAGVGSGLVSFVNGNLTSASPDLIIHQYDTAGAMTIASNITGNILLAKTGPGTVLLIGTSNSYTGKTVIYGGLLAIAADSSLGAAPGSFVSNQLQLSGGGLQFLGSTSLSPNRGVSLVGSGTFDTNGNTDTIGGAISPAVATSVVGITKSGLGTLTLTAVETFSGPITVSNGVLALTGSMQTDPTSAVTVGNTAGVNAVLQISGGTVTANKTTVPSIQTSTVVGSAGIIHLNGGILTSASEIDIGRGAGSASSTSGTYAALTINGGTVTAGGFVVIGGAFDTAAFNQSGGIFNINNLLILANTANGPASTLAVANISGGTVTANSGGIEVGQGGTGVLNITGGVTSFSNNPAALGGLRLGENSNANGIVNLIGGTLTINRAQHNGATNSVSVLNFNGGALFGNSSQTTFLNANLDAGSTASHVYVWGNGANIIDGGFAITAAAGLEAPTGSGITSISMTGGTGFIDTPVVQIVGDGFGATAVANIDPVSGTLTGITVTNPGVNYTGATITLLGGGIGSGGAAQSSVLMGANASGGLNKSGTGTLTLSSTANTYTGPTNVLGGTLVVSGCLSGGGNIIVAANSAFKVGGGIVSSPVTIGAGGTVGGFGTITGAVSVAAGGAVDMSDGTAGTLNLSSGVTINATNSPGILKFDYDVSGNGTNGASDFLTTGSNSINVNGTNPIVVYLNAVQLSSPFQTEVLASFGGTAPNFIIDPNATKNGFNTVSISTTAVPGQLVLFTTGKATPAQAFWTGNFGSTWTALDSLLFNDNFVDAGGLNTNQYPGSTSDVIFSANTTNSSFATTLGSVSFSINGVIIQTGSAVSIGGSSTLTLGAHGILNNATAGGIAISAPLVLGVSQTWGNLSTVSNINVTGTISGNASSSLYIVGNVRLAGANTFTGGTFIAPGGTLTTGSAGALGNGGLNFVSGSNGRLELLGTGLNVLSLNGDSTATISNDSNANATLTFNGTQANSTFGGTLQNGTGSGVLSLLVSGGGTLVTTGTNIMTGGITVRNGLLNVAGGGFSTPTAGLIGNATTSATLQLNGGTLAFTGTADPSINIGTVLNAAGVLRINSGVLTTASEIWIAPGPAVADTNNSSYGAMIINGGTVTVGSWLAIARGQVGGSAGVGILEQSGGIVTVQSNALTLGSYQGTAGVLHAVFNMYGGTMTVGGGSIYAGENLNGIVNILNGVAIAGNVVAGNAAGVTGELSLIGGTLTSRITGPGGTGIVNFNGGVLQANSTNTLVTGSANETNRIWGGGAFFDVNGFTATVGANLLAPTGSGVSVIPVTAVTSTNATAASGATILVVASNSYLATGMTITSNSTSIPAGTTITAISGNNGTNSATITLSTATIAPLLNVANLTLDYEGYIANPLVSITGGGGTGATAIAQTDTNGKLISIRITNPGVGYTSQPTVTLAGNASSATPSGPGRALVGPITLAANGTDGGVTVLGTGTLVMSGAASNYSGDTRVTVDTLALGANNGLSPNSVLKVSGSGTVTGTGAFSGAAAGIDDSISPGTGAVVGFTTLTISPVSGQSWSYSGALSANSLIKAGLGTQVLLGTGINFTSSTLSGGSLVLQGLNLIGTGSLTVGAGSSTLLLQVGTNSSNVVTLGTAGTRISTGTANIVLADGTNGVNNGLSLTSQPAGLIDQGTFFNGADYAVVDGTSFFVRAPIYGTDSNFSAADALSSGSNALVTAGDTLSATSLNTVKVSGGSGSLNLAGNTLSTLGILKSGGGAGFISGGTIMNPNSGIGASGDLVIRADAASDVLTINASIADNGGTTLVKAGNGVVVLGGPNTITGKTYIYGGSLALANSLALQSSTIVYPALSGKLSFSGITSATIAGLQNTSGNAQSVSLQNDASAPVALTILYNSTTTSSTATSFSGSGSLVKDGNGRLDLNGSSSFTGGVTILNGTLTANAVTTLGGTSVESSLGTGTITLAGGVLRTTAALNLANPVVVTGNASYDSNNTSNVTFSGNLTGGGTLTRIGGTGSMTFSGTNSGFTGSFIASANSSSTIFTSIAALSSNANWTFNAGSVAVSTAASSTLTLGGLSGAAGVNLNVANTTTSTITTLLQVGGLNGNTTFAGNITDSANGTNNNNMSLVMVGTGTFTLLGAASNYLGAIISNGTLAVGTLDAGAFTTATSNSLTSLSLTSVTGVSAGMFVAGANVRPGTTVASLTGNVATLSLPLTASSSTLSPVQFLGANALGVAGSVTIASGASLQYVGTATTTSVKTFVLSNGAALDASGTGTVTYKNTAALTWDATGVARTLSLTGTSLVSNTLAATLTDNATGPVSVIKSGIGTWALTNSANTFSGGLVVNGGFLLLNNTAGNSAGISVVTVNPGGALGGSGSSASPVLVNAGGQLGAGAPTGTRVGTLTLTGTTTLAAGSILNVDLSSPGVANPGDIINLGNVGSLVLPGTPGSVGVNLLNASLTSAYFFNGTYNVFTGIPNAASASLASSISSLTTLNENTTGTATFTFTVAAGTGSTSRIQLAIAGGWNSGTWSNANSSNLWTDNGDWVGGVPNGSGHVATFGTLVAAGGTVTMNGNKTLNSLTFSNSNGYTIDLPNSTNTLFMQNGTTTISSVIVQLGSNTINANVELDSATDNFSLTGGASLTLGGNVTGVGSLSLSGSGVLAITGNASYTGGTNISQATSILQIGNGGATGSLAGVINLAGTLIFDRNNVVNFDPVNLVQTTTGGTLTQGGTGTLVLSTATPGTFVPGVLAATSGVVQFGSNGLFNTTQTGGISSFVSTGTGKIDMNGHTEDIRDLVMTSGGILDNTSSLPAVLNLHSATSQTMGGTITNSGSGPLSIIKDNTGTITVTGLFNNAGSLYISAGQIVFNNSSPTTLSGLIVMNRSTTGSAGLILGSNADVTSPLQLSVLQGTNEFVSTSGGNGTFSGNVTVDPAAFFSAVQVRLGNFNAGTLTFAGGTVTIPSGTKGLVSRGIVALSGNELLDNQNTGSFQIGVASNAVTFISAGNSTLQTETGDFSPGITLGATGDTSTAVHTIQDGAIVRLSADGNGVYDLNPSTASTSSNTLNLNGGSLILSSFELSGNPAVAGSSAPGAYPQGNVIFNGGAVVAGLFTSDMASSFGPTNLKFTIGAGGMTLDINQQPGVQWSKQLTSTSTGTAFTDGGLAYISGSGPGTITLATHQLYKGATTIGKNAVVVVSSNDVLGDPSVGAAVNFAGGTLAMTGNLSLSLQDGGTATLTHRFSFNSSDPTFDSGVGFDNANANNNTNATFTNNRVVMTGLANSASAISLGITDLSTNPTYLTDGATIMAWYTPQSTAGFSYIFSAGGTAPSGGYQYLAMSPNYNGSVRAFITASGSPTASGAAGEIGATGAAPSNNVEHQMTLTIDNSNISIYIDGVLEQTTPLTTANGGTILQGILNGVGTSIFSLGGSTYPGDPSFNGSIDEFRVYDTVLSQQYIAASFNASADAIAPTVSVNRNITVANSTVSGASNGAVDLAGFELDIGGNMSGAGTLTLFDGGSVVLTGNSAAGLNIASNVQLFVGTGGSLGALTGGNVANAGKIFINRTDAAGVWGANISDGLTAGTITLVGSGTTTITGTNTYTGPLLVNAGKLLVGANGTTGTLGSGSVTLAGVLGFNRSDNGLSVAATITGGGTVTQVGSGITSVSGNNSYTGGTIFANGELEVDSLNAIGTTGLLSFTGGALRYSATNTSNYQSRFSTAPGQLYAFDTNGQTITFTSPLTSTGNSALTKLGAGTLVLTTTNAYSNTNVNGGVLQVNNGADIGSGTVTFGGPGILAFNRSGSNVVSDTIAGAGGTLSQLVGASVITGTNTFSGGVSIAPGAAVQIGNGGAVGSIGTAGVANNGALVINRTGSLTIAGPVSGAGTVTNSNSGTVTFAGAIPPPAR